MSDPPRWEAQARNGRRYYRFLQNGQLRYRLDDGRTLTQREFDQLPDLRVPRSTPDPTAIKEPQGYRDTPAQHGTRQRPPGPDERSSQDHIIGSTPETRYIAVPRDDSRDRNSKSHATAYISGQGGTAIYPANQLTRQYSEQTLEATGQRTIPKNEHLSGGDGLPPRLNQLCEDFLSIPMGQYSKLWSFVIDHRDIVSRTEIDNLIAEASRQKRLGKNAQTLVHHALILRRCKELDTKGREQFFKDLANRNGDTLQDFVNNVKVVYATMSGPPGQPSQISNNHSQNWNTPVVVQSGAQASRHAPEYASQGQEQDTALPSESGGPRKDLAPEGQAYSSDLRLQERRGRDKDGKLVYVDEFGRILRPASSRHESDRSQAETTNTEIARGMRNLRVGEIPTRDERALEARAVAFENPNRHVETSNHQQQRPPTNRRQSVSSGAAMPTLHEGMAAHGREFQGTGVEPEKLDPRYKIRGDAESFFVKGRVFSLLWHEPAGQPNSDMSKPVRVTRGRFGEEIFSHILRMVVVMEQHGACWCLPVNTYGGRGVSKSGFSKADREAHTIIYMSDTVPTKLPEESGMNKKPIAVDKSSTDQRLHPSSRLNFAKIHTVGWNVKVMDVGTVARESMPLFVTYWRQSLE